MLDFRVSHDVPDLTTTALSGCSMIGYTHSRFIPVSRGELLLTLLYPPAPLIGFLAALGALSFPFWTHGIMRSRGCLQTLHGLLNILVTSVTHNSSL